MADLKTVAEQLVNLTVKEVNELAKILTCCRWCSPSCRGKNRIYGNSEKQWC